MWVDIGFANYKLTLDFQTQRLWVPHNKFMKFFGHVSVLQTFLI